MTIGQLNGCFTLKIGFLTDAFTLEIRLADCFTLKFRLVKYLLFLLKGLKFGLVLGIHKGLKLGLVKSLLNILIGPKFGLV